MNPTAQWEPPESWIKITAIDAHTEGEPLRIIRQGYPPLPGDTMLEKRRYAKENYDHLRKALMWEPRGHADMYGCIITPAVTRGADFGVLFMHNAGFSTMCGHDIIGVTKVALETGMLEPDAGRTEVKIDTPAGIVTARAIMDGAVVKSVAFRNIPSFVLSLNQTVNVPGLGHIHCDIAFGGAFYAYVDAEEAGVSLTPEDFRPIIEKGMAIKRAVAKSFPIEHPFEADLSFQYGTIFTGPAQSHSAHSRNVCVFAEGEVDRSPTGTGVCGRMAIHYARGEVGLDQPLVIESIIGSRFTGRVLESLKFGPYDAVIPEVEGTAHITGQSEFYIDPDDELGRGFILR